MASTNGSDPTATVPTIIQPPSTQALDLESELSCSICTDLLYQPLTLLDCLHTYCGSCLKEWFRQQGKAVHPVRRHHGETKYTCPSCRAPVRDTKPNATVTTLLDMYMRANPEKGKSKAERDEIASKYSPGDKLVPSPEPSSTQDPRRQRLEREQEETDRRVVEAVRELSIRQGNSARGSAGSGASRSRVRRSQETSRTRQDEEVSPHRAAREELTRQLRQRQGLRPGQSLRSLEHQASLRTLMSASRTDPAVSLAVQSDVLRHIMEEGLLEHVDLANLTPQDEQVLSDTIAQAYLNRRNRGRTPSESGQAEANSTTERPQRDTSQRPPPVSRPRLLDTPRATRSRDRRSSSGGSSRSTNVSDHAQSSSEAVNLVVSSVPSDQPQTRRLRRTSNDIIVSRPVSMEQSRGSTERRTRSDQTTVTTSRTVISADQAPQHSSPIAISPPATSAPNRTPTRSNHGTSDQASMQQRAGTRDSIFHAPIIHCSNCKRPNIQYGLHYTCNKCLSDDGAAKFSLCQRCYISGTGCKHWYGFGKAAAIKFAQQFPDGYSSNIELPHTLSAERWVSVPESDRAMRGASQLQSGLFCATCQVNSNACHWSCDKCNEGELGYCNTCVNQGRHCTHPLLPIALDSPEDGADAPEDLAKHMIPLPIHTSCDHCQNPISPTSTRFHCPTCNDGDYDICNLCYRSLVASGNISETNGPRGWRKCINGHRMLIVGFDHRSDGQRRVVVEGIIGGWRMPSEEAVGLPHADERGHVVFPPSGGYGRKMVAVWTRLPEEGVEDELMFPKHAEIGEVVEMNQNWCWGVYCRVGKVFPVAFCRAV